MSAPTGDWTVPGPELVAPGVHRIPLPLPTDGLKAVNVYALVTPGSVTLIDGGWRIEAARDALAAGLRQLGLQVQDVTRCLVTHHHRDHYTLATELRRTVGTSIALGRGEAVNLAAIRVPGRVLEVQRAALLRAGAAELLAAVAGMDRDPIAVEDWEDPDTWVADGDLVTLPARTLRVRETPGHTLGHVVYVDDAAGLLFAGDHVLPHITPSVGLEASETSSPLADYLVSLAAVLGEPDRLLLPAHGPAGGSAHRRVEQLLDHHEVRLERTCAVVAAGATTGYEAAAALPWTRRERSFAELDVFNRMLAVTETVAHLEVLLAQGRVHATESDGVRCFGVG
jgi:glyoxylase-like metal-dependent hydrolase (beta-lactamase superfamily II)